MNTVFSSKLQGGPGANVEDWQRKNDEWAESKLPGAPWYQSNEELWEVEDVIKAERSRFEKKNCLDTYSFGVHLWYSASLRPLAYATL